MFEDNSIFVILKDNSIYKLETDGSTQVEINQIYADAVESISEKQAIPFNGSYYPLEDEVLSISPFILPDPIKDALRNPAGVDSFVPNIEHLQDIKAIFVGFCENTDHGEKFIAAFQRFRKEQYISAGKINLFFDDSTFKQKKGIGISIGDFVDSYFDGSVLYFISFHYARQIFNLSGYYRTATDEDISTFLRSEIIDFGSQEQKDAFKEKANTWVRRKVALINDSEVLRTYSAIQIKRIAMKHSGIDIKVKDKQIVLPTDFEEIKVLLRFLDEESWKGPFTNETYISSSKRKVAK